MITIEKLTITSAINGKTFTFKPFINTTEQQNFLYKLLNTNKVYNTLRDGKPWLKKLILEKSKHYHAGVTSLLQDNYQYNPKSFVICWIIYDNHNQPIGRGGFQPDNSLQPILSDLFGALLPEYHTHGLASAISNRMIDWFRQYISNHATIRGLALQNNIPSQIVLQKNNFTPVCDRNKQLTINAWGKPYLVYERKH